MPVYSSSDDEFPSHLNENKKVVVKFYSEWSGTCKLLLPKYQELADDDRFDHIIFLDVNIEENPVAWKNANMDSVPAIAYFKKGQLRLSETVVNDEELINLIQEIAS